MAASGLLLTLLSTQECVSENNLRLIQYQHWRDNIASEITKIEKKEEAFDHAVEKATDPKNNLMINGRVVVQAGNMNEAIAEQYAEMLVHMKRAQIDATMYKLNEEESDWDIQIEAIKADNTIKNEFVNSVKEQLKTEAQNTHMLS